MVCLLTNWHESIYSNNNNNNSNNNSKSILKYLKMVQTNCIACYDIALLEDC